MFKRANLHTISSRTKEGLYVSSGDPNRRDKVSIHVQIDFDQELADEWAQEVRTVLDANGLVFKHYQNAEGYHRFVVLGRPIISG